MMSVRTLGTSEKKKSAKTPATIPNDPAVVALYLKREALAVRFYGKPVWLKIHGFSRRPRVKGRENVSVYV